MPRFRAADYPGPPESKVAYLTQYLAATMVAADFDALVGNAAGVWLMKHIFNMYLTRDDIPIVPYPIMHLSTTAKKLKKFYRAGPAGVTTDVVRWEFGERHPVARPTEPLDIVVDATIAHGSEDVRLLMTLPRDPIDMFGRADWHLAWEHDTVAVYDMQSSDYFVDGCAACGAKSGLLRRCSGCKVFKYCGDACQRSHWRHHKADCKALAGRAK